MPLLRRLSTFSTVLAVLAGSALSGCSAVTVYYAKENAPEHIRNGGEDGRLAVTQTFGEPLSPVIRNMAVPFGRLHFAQGLERHLLATLKPLDIILVRSRPAVTRLILPSHFTHAAIWLGTRREMQSLGAFRLPSVRAHAAELVDGNVLYEAAGDAVRIAGIDQVTNTDEIVVLRLSGVSRARALSKYGALFQRLGTPFDYNFDYLDTSRLTCTEIVASVFPELSVPVRYTTGRYAVIPDDVVRRALSSGSGLRVVEHIVSDGADGYSILGEGATRSRLTQPKPKPTYATFY